MTEAGGAEKVSSRTLSPMSKDSDVRVGRPCGGTQMNHETGVVGMVVGRSYVAAEEQHAGPFVGDEPAAMYADMENMPPGRE